MRALNGSQDGRRYTLTNNFGMLGVAPEKSGMLRLLAKGASPIEDAARLSLQSVAQIFNLPYRGIAFRGPSAGASQRNVSTLCRLQIGETAECNSALRGCPCPSSIGDAPEAILLPISVLRQRESFD